MAYDERDRTPVKIDGVRCIAVNKKATSILCEHDDWDEPIWIGQSLISDDSEVYTPGTEGILIVPRWLAVKENML